MLKTNSRFTCLVDNMVQNREPRTRRNLPPNREASRNKNNNTKIVSNSFQKKTGYEMDINNFPSLSTIPNKSTRTNMNESYIENLTKPTKQEDIVNSENLAKGWISMKGSSRIILKSKRTIPSLEPRYIEMMNRINTNYVNYKENYIELWGEEEYKYMFLFPNYNYFEYDNYTDDEEDDEEEYDDEY